MCLGIFACVLPRVDSYFSHTTVANVRSPGTGFTGGCEMLVLRIEPWSSGRVAIALFFVCYWWFLFLIFCFFLRDRISLYNNSDWNLFFRPGWP